MHYNCELMFHAHMARFFSSDLRVLEIGPVDTPSLFCKSVPSKRWDYLVFYPSNQAKGENVIETHEPFRYPIEDQTYDIVFSANVLEHVEDLELWFDELKRITKVGGKLMFVAPVSWPYHSSATIADCQRLYPKGIEPIAKRKGLDVLVNVFDSLEKKHVPSWIATIPGEGREFAHEYETRKMKFYFFFSWVLTKLRLFFFRKDLTVAYDLASVLQKR